MRKKINYIFRIIDRTEKRKFWTQILLNVLISLADIAALVLLLLVINFYINKSDKGLDFLPAWMLERDKPFLIACFFAVFTIKNMFGILISNAQFSFIGNVAVRISVEKLKDYLHGDFSNFINSDSSEFIRKIAFQPFEFCQHVLSGFQQILIQFFLVFITTLSILVFNAKLFLLLLLILLPPVALVFFIIRKKINLTKKNIHRSNEASFKYLIDALKGFVESNVYQRNEFFLSRFVKARKQFSKYLFESLAIQALPSRVIESFAVLGLFILILIANWNGNNNSTELITIGAFMAAAYKIIPGIVKIINATSQLNAYEFSIHDLLPVTRDKKRYEKENRVSIESIQFERLSFCYGEQQVIKDLSFSINKGDFLGISGPSGNGKTTLFNLLLGLLKPSSGVIRINNEYTEYMDLSKFWPGISYMRQQNFLINDTIIKNITLSDNAPDQTQLDQAIKIAGLNELIHSDKGLNNIITENGKNISGGQQQRICIARTLYKNADLILLDEPFNELDENSAERMCRQFQELANGGKMVIMITHDSKNLAFCNKRLQLDVR